MKKEKIYITLEGGFHNAEPVRVLVSKNQYIDFNRGLITLSEMLSQYQKTKLDKHFCGVSGCTCGSFTTADIRL